MYYLAYLLTCAVVPENPDGLEGKSKQSTVRKANGCNQKFLTWSQQLGVVKPGFAHGRVHRREKNSRTMV